MKQLQYYYFINNERIGPLSIENLKPNQIDEDTLVWVQGMQNWQKARDVSDFDDYLIMSKISSEIPQIPPLPTHRIEVHQQPKMQQTLANNDIYDAIENGLCPITGKHRLETIITIRKWRYYFFFISMHKIEVPVSFEGKKIHQQQLGTVWEIIDRIGSFFMHIPFFGGFIVLMIFVYGFTICIPLWIILDLFFERKRFGLGKIRINSNNDLYLVQS